jgi:hypothetical protein
MGVWLGVHGVRGIQVAPEIGLYLLKDYFFQHGAGRAF